MFDSIVASISENDNDTQRKDVVLTKLMSLLHSRIKN